MNKNNFKSGMAMLLQCFPNKDISLDLAWNLLKDVDDEKYIIAVKDICSTYTEMFPNTNIIGLIREIALSGVHLLEGEAWEEVLNQIRKEGYYGKPVFSNENIKKAVDAIGWRTLCDSENISVERSHFIKIYSTYINRTKENNTKLPEVRKMIESTCENKAITHNS